MSSWHCQQRKRKHSNSTQTKNDILHKLVQLIPLLHSPLLESAVWLPIVETLERRCQTWIQLFDYLFVHIILLWKENMLDLCLLLCIGWRGIIGTHDGPERKQCFLWRVITLKMKLTLSDWHWYISFTEEAPNELSNSNYKV